MNPRLVALSGASDPVTWAAQGGPLVLGRDSSNQVEVRDTAVSRQHCAITEISAGIFELADLQSHHGTFVNGAKITRKILQHGDRIRVGDSEFAFLTGAQEALSPPPASGPQSTSAEWKTNSEDDSGLLSSASGIMRMARDLTAFFKVTKVIVSRDTAALQQELLALIGEVIPATQAAIVLLSSAQEEPAKPCTWKREGVSEPDILVREDLVRKVTWERCTIYNETTSSEHVLCAPLVGVERTLGVIYLSSPAAGPAFGEDHACFLSAVSRIAAITLENLARLDSLRDENQRLRADVGAETELLGESRAMRRVRGFVARVAPSDSNVLIRGESGTGKEIVARAIHTGSPRSAQPFLAINCAAIPETLLETELFGHEKGAFTGAIAVKKGKLEATGEGTLFLDEVGDMAPLLQSKVLRVLQQREFERIGGNRLLPFNGRVLAATNKNLEQAIKAGEFRQDLYYRLNVVSITLPPLREHRDDIPGLALHFANKYAAKCTRSFTGIAADARSLLMQYSWPGNIRELENAIEHAIVMGLTDEILPDDLPTALLEEQSSALSSRRYHDTLNHTKKQLVLTALGEAEGSPVEAARLLGIHPKYLHRLIRNLNLKSEGKRSE